MVQVHELSALWRPTMTHSKMDAKMDPIEQIKLEYGTLRKEIEAAKVWECRLFVGIIIGFPAALELVQKIQADNQLSYFILFLPAAVVALSLLFVFVRRTAMRCGSYIHEVLEPHFPLDGWESWRWKSRKRSGPERLITSAFLLIIVVYYGFAAVIALKNAQSYFGTESMAIFVALYLAGLVLIGTLVASQTRIEIA
jgi:hypothetical protein